MMPMDPPQGIGGFQDDNGGLGYHIQVGYRKEDDSAASLSQNESRSSCLNIVHIAVEMAPIAKVCHRHKSQRLR
jgi:hypothetical protein